VRDYRRAPLPVQIRNTTQVKGLVSEPLTFGILSSLNSVEHRTVKKVFGGVDRRRTWLHASCGTTPVSLRLFPHTLEDQWFSSNSFPWRIECRAE